MSFGLVNNDPVGLKILGVLLVVIPLLVIASFLLPLFVSVIIVNYLLLYLTILFLLLYIEHPDEKNSRLAKKPFSLAVLVASYNSKNTIQKCIDAIKAMNYQIPFRIIVADDGSTDGSRQMLEKMSGIRLLKLPHRGKGFALNDGLKIIKEEAIVCIDSDTYPTPNTLLDMVGHLDDKKVGAINAMLIPDKRETFIQKVQYFEYMMGFGFWNTVLSSINIMSYVTGPLTVFRRAALQKAGYYFDTFNLAEDMEIGMRLQKFGYKVKVCASVCCETDVPETIKKLAKQRDRWYRSRVFNLIKHRDLFFNSVNAQLGFFGLPYLFMVELLMIVLLLRVGLLIVSNILNWLQVGSLVVFSANSFPILRPEFVLSTQTYFFAASLAVIFIQYAFGFGLAKYKIKKDDILPLIFQFTVYPYFIAFVYLRGMLREFKGAKPVWERAST